MNIVEMHEYCDEFIDKANAPWFSPEQKDIYLNFAQAEFVEERYKAFEVSERTRQELSTLVKVVNFTNTKTINLSNIPDFVFVLNLNGEYPTVCGSGKVYRSITPEQIDDIVENQNDPFNVNDDTQPGYVQYNVSGNTTIEIYSKTIPTSINLYYLKRQATMVNDESNPTNNVDCELPDFVHEEIVERACRKMLSTLQDQVGYQIQENEINKLN